MNKKQNKKTIIKTSIIINLKYRQLKKAYVFLISMQTLERCSQLQSSYKMYFLSDDDDGDFIELESIIDLYNIL